ncbi:MAG TPA: BrnT family toxin [Alphaproteobacteria bacterium]|nr:BrnT family toxin [Alphaproteobacteria bacterium]
MDFEWNERKRANNLAKHGVDFVRACRVWEENDRIVVIEDTRRDYREARFQAFGFVDGILLVVAFSWRGKSCRIISARRASKDERKAYDACIGQAGARDQG